jgi:hypothetical protein
MSVYQSIQRHVAEERNCQYVLETGTLQTRIAVTPCRLIWYRISTWTLRNVSTGDKLCTEIDDPKYILCHFTCLINSYHYLKYSIYIITAVLNLLLTKDISINNLKDKTAADTDSIYIPFNSNNCWRTETKDARMRTTIWSEPHLRLC